MSLMRQLSVLAIHQVLGDRAESLIGFLGERLSDKSARFEQAMARATEKAWNILDLALAGPAIRRSWRTVFSPRDEKTLQQNIYAFLSSIPEMHLPQDHATFCRLSRAELHQARKKGLIPGHRASLADVIHEHHRILEQCFEPVNHLKRSQQLLKNLADELSTAGFTNLAVFISLQPTGGQPLLVQLVHYFFRREIEADPALCSILTLEKLTNIDDSFRSTLDKLNHSLETHSAELQALLSDVGDTVSATHEGVQLVGRRMSETMELVSSTRDDVASLKHQLECQQVELQRLTALLQQMLESGGETRHAATPEGKSQSADVLAAETPTVSESLDWSQVRLLLAKAQQFTQAEPQRRAEVSELASRLAASAENFEATQRLVRELQAAENSIVPIPYDIPPRFSNRGSAEKRATTSERKTATQLISRIFLEGGLGACHPEGSTAGPSSKYDDNEASQSSSDLKAEGTNDSARMDDRSRCTNKKSTNLERKRFLSPIFDDFCDGDEGRSEQSG
ncbi:MAG: hypothetical protein N2039_03290 [Gemmataceae bacterium]|nr:hypothetical protein [Gemmataceae bacterium]